MDSVHWPTVLDRMLVRYESIKSSYNPNASPAELDSIYKALIQHNEAFKKQLEVASMMSTPIEERWKQAIEECSKGCVEIAAQLESIPLQSPIEVTKQIFEKHNKLIRCVDKIQDTYGESFKNFGIDLPRIIVIGEENVGKSSVLESIAGVGIFPRAEGLCTRLPFQMRMHHRTAERMVKDYSSKIENPANAVVVTFADAPDVLLSDPNEIRKRVSDITMQKTKGFGVRDEVVILNVYSTAVADLTIIDLPGIINAHRPNEPKNIHDVTLQMVRRYIGETDDTIILAVVPANQPISNSQALREVQVAGAERRTIAVITKVDLATPRDKVDMKIMGTSADSIALPNGYIGVVNQDTEEPQKLTEEDFFKNTYPDLWQREKVGRFALTKQLNVLLDQHIRSKWAPRTKNVILSKQIDVKRSLDSLGPPVPLSDLKTFFQAQMSEFCNEFTKDLDSHLANMYITINQFALASKMKNKIELAKSLVEYARHDYIKDKLLKTGLEKCKLSRFASICETVKRVYEQQSIEPMKMCLAMVEQIAELDSYSLPSGAQACSAEEPTPENCPICRADIKSETDSGGVVTLHCSSTAAHKLHVACFMRYILLNRGNGEFH